MPTTTRLPKPCVGYYDKERHQRVLCGKLCARSRCDEHEAMYQATRRPPASQRGYDAQYRRDRAKILAPDPETGARALCALRLDGCTVYADTADHADPLLGGKNLAARRGRLEPACASCNSKRGARPAFHLPRSTRATSDDVRADEAEEGPAPGGTMVVMPDGSVR